MGIENQMHFGIPYFGELLSFLTAFVWPGGHSI
jgi:hypothetical protein